MPFKCKKCGGKMEYSYSDRRGDIYKCEECGNKGFSDGLSDPGAPVDPEAFGL